jgi:glycosyltransferase involved in cell wall biosynthesis
MKICIISALEDAMLKDTGPSVRIYNLAKSFVALGNDVEMVLPKFKQTCENIDGVTVHFLKGFFPKMLLEQISKLLGILRPTSLFSYDPLFVYKVCKIIQASDVVQFEQQSAGALLIPIVAKIFKKPIIIDCHNIFQPLKIKETNLVRKIIETSIEKMIYRFADMILTVSEKERQIFLSYAIGKVQIEVIPNGVETKVFSKPANVMKLREYYGLVNKRVVVFVGNMQYAPNKEAVHLIATKIAPEVVKTVKDAKFIIVGRTAGTKYSNLQYFGVVKDVVPLLAVSDVAIAPLLNGAGTRLKILEYFSCGLPVVSTTVGAEGLEVKNYTHVMIEDDMAVFASKLAQLLNDTKLSKQLGQSARQLVIEKYDWTKIASHLNEVIQRMLI